MKKLTGKQIIQKLTTNCTLSQIAYMDCDYEELGLGEVEEVEQVGGEDQGSTWYSVQHFTDHDVYIKIDGYYQSYAGTEFEDIPYEVVPTEVKVIQYLPKLILTAAKINEILKENRVSYESFAYMDYNAEKLGFGEIEEVERYGGEDQGSTWYSVQHFKDHGIYMRIDGYYQSHYGTDFETAPYEVFPRERTIIEFVA